MGAGSDSDDQWRRNLLRRLRRSQGQPVLLLHGGPGNTEEFINLTPVLVSAGCRVIAMDCRGHGRSSWGDLPITYAQMAADAIRLLDDLGIEQTDVVGWSDGADRSLDLAIHHPERLNRAVAYGANVTTAGVRDLQSGQTPPFERYIVDYRRLSPEPERFEELFDTLEALYTVAPNYSESELQGIPLPDLSLDGADDEDIMLDQPQRMAALIPGVTLVIMPDPGHFALFARPAVFSQIVLDYLDGKTLAVTSMPIPGTPVP